MKLYVLLALLAESAKDDPEPEVAQAQLWILVAELRNQDCCAHVEQIAKSVENRREGLRSTPYFTASPLATF